MGRSIRIGDVFLTRVAMVLEAYVLADNEFLAIPAPGSSLVNGWVS